MDKTVAQVAADFPRMKASRACMCAACVALDVNALRLRRLARTRVEMVVRVALLLLVENGERVELVGAQAHTLYVGL
jgi:hypothetical protein